jgi:hypothetical protein
MIGKGLKDYIMIRAAIFGLRLIAPVSLGYLAISLYCKKFLLSAWLGPCMLVEASFYLFTYLPRYHLMQTVRFHVNPLLYPNDVHRRLPIPL